MGNETFEAGLRTRRDVLGAEHVDRSLAAASPFSRPVQDLVTEFCWGSVWTREGLPRKTRSLINIAMLTALNRNHELELHIRASFNNGATEQDVQEVLLQTAAYCGFPAALESFRVAQRVIDERARAAAQDGAAKDGAAQDGAKDAAGKGAAQVGAGS